jgi:hypothetical protein
MAEYSYLVLYLPRGTSTDAARRILTDHAEYGNWELSRLRRFPDGSRKATLRRMIIRQARAQLGIGADPGAAAQFGMTGWRVPPPRRGLPASGAVKAPQAGRRQAP